MKPGAALTALAIGAAAAAAGFNVLSHLSPSNRASDRGLASLTRLGEMTPHGEVQVRLPRNVRFEDAKAAAPFYSQEMITTRGEATASLNFDSGTVIRELGNSRLVAEQDPNHADAIFLTILSGQVEWLKAASSGKVHFLRDGREVALTLGATTPLLPVIKSSGAARLGVTVFEAPTPTAITASTVDESNRPNSTRNATASSINKDNFSNETGAPLRRELPASPKPGAVSTGAGEPGHTAGGLHYTLGNDDINRQVKMQMSFFQRCYLNYVSRTTGAAASARPPTATSGAGSSAYPALARSGGGQVVLGFMIQNTGRVSNAHIVHSDFDDATLQKCLTEVIERTPFHAFAGDTIEVSEYPILLQ